MTRSGIKTRRSNRRSPRTPAKPPLTPGAPPASEVEQVTAQVERLLATRTPRLRIYELMAPMPPRTVDDYIARARDRLAAAIAAQRPQLIAEMLLRLDQLEEERLKGKKGKTVDLIRAERFRAELLGLVGKEATQVNVAVGVQAGGGTRGPDLALWTAEEIAEYQALVDQAEALEARVVRRLALPGPDGAPHKG